MSRQRIPDTRLHKVPVFIESLEEDFWHAVFEDAGAKPESKERRFHYVVGKLSGVKRLAKFDHAASRMRRSRECCRTFLPLVSRSSSAGKS